MHNLPPPSPALTTSASSSLGLGATSASPGRPGQRPSAGREGAAGRNVRLVSPSPLGPRAGLRDRPAFCQPPRAEMDVEPGRTVSAALGEIHFPRCSGRKMGRPRHPSALQRSGKQASFSENSLERSPAPQGLGDPPKAPGCVSQSWAPAGWDPRGSHTHPQRAKVRNSAGP